MRKPDARRPVGQRRAAAAPRGRNRKSPGARLKSLLANAHIDATVFEVKHLLGVGPRGARPFAAGGHAQCLDFDPLRADGVAVDERNGRSGGLGGGKHADFAASKDCGVGFRDRVRRILAVGWRIDDQQAPGLVAGHAKRMEDARRHVGPRSGTHHFDAALRLRLTGAFDHVGALFQVRMRVRLRAMRFHDRADQHFERRRAHGLGADHAHVGSAGVVRRGVGGKVRRPDHGGYGLHSG